MWWSGSVGEDDGLRTLPRGLVGRIHSMSRLMFILPWIGLGCTAAAPTRPCPPGAQPSRAPSALASTNVTHVGWLPVSPANYARLPWRLDGRFCLVEFNRCPFESASVPRCPADAQPTPDFDSHTGHIVTVGGRLTIGWIGSTHKGCSVFGPCCNEHQAPLVLEPDYEHRVVLLDSELPAVCKGDQTRLCCPVDSVGRAVLARGVVRRMTEVPGTDATLVMERPEICITDGNTSANTFTVPGTERKAR